jgi:2,7-dihydroxy-5-methyl-1-naphthoate 7-O-methyltransferase
VSPDDWSQELWDMADLITPMTIRVTATLRLADHVVAGATTVDALSTAAGCDPDALGRLVGHLVTIGLLARTGDGALELTGLGERLRADHPGGMCAWLDIGGAVGRGDLAMAYLLETVRNGKPAYPLMYGREFWDDLGADEALSASFDALGSEITLVAPAVVAGYPWRSVGHLVDVGGGNGTLLTAILAANPQLRGTLIDLAGPAAAATRALAAAGLSGRSQVVSGSFFEPLPAGGDVYLLSSVVHNWSDDDVAGILRGCVAAAAPGGRVVIAQGLLDPAGGATPRTAMDLRMLTYVTGRERTAADLATVAAAAGLTVTSVTEVAPNCSLMALARS